MDVLAVGRAAGGGVAADAKGAAGALFDEADLDLLPLELRLAEAAAEQVGRDAAVLLAEFDRHLIALAVHHAGLGPDGRGKGQAEPGKKDPQHYLSPQKIAKLYHATLPLPRLSPHHGAMLSNIPTHVIAGPLGAGKTSLIRQLLAQKPEGERWAVLINEFGQIGLDAALLSTDQQGIRLAE